MANQSRPAVPHHLGMANQIPFEAATICAWCSSTRNTRERKQFFCWLWAHTIKSIEAAVEWPEKKVGSSHRRVAVNVFTTACPARLIARAITADDAREVRPVST